MPGIKKKSHIQKKRTNEWKIEMKKNANPLRRQKSRELKKKKHTKNEKGNPSEAPKSRVAW